MTGGPDRVAVVTGANRGVGRALVVAYAEAGYAVAVTAREPAICAGTVAEVGSRGGTAVALACDVAPSPLGRVVDAADVARACTFLSSDAATSITGEDLNVNAGVAMY